MNGNFGCREMHLAGSSIEKVSNPGLFARGFSAWMNPLHRDQDFTIMIGA